MDLVHTSEPVQPANWYAVYVWTRHEKKVADHLTRKGVQTFLPLYYSKRQWKNRARVELELPLFPGYLFTRIAVSEQLRVLETPGALSLVGSAAGPIAVPEHELAALRQALSLRKAEPHPFLKQGERVRVIAGPMRGLEGILIRFRQDYRVVLSIDLIMRSVAVEIDTCDLEPISAKPAVDYEVHGYPVTKVQPSYVCK